jgi:hypothetical protein
MVVNGSVTFAGHEIVSVEFRREKPGICPARAPPPPAPPPQEVVGPRGIRRADGALRYHYGLARRRVP